MFYRSKFSATLNVSDRNISRTIQFIVCSHNFTSLPTEEANLSAHQSFISNDGLSLDDVGLILDIPDNSSPFALICVLGLSVAFTSGPIKRVFSRLRTTANSTGYEILAEILRSHARRWTPREPEPRYEVRQYLFSNPKPQKPAETLCAVKPKTTATPKKPDIRLFNSKITGQIHRRQITAEKSASNRAARIPSSLPSTTDSTSASFLTSDFGSKIPKPVSQFGQHRTTAAVPRPRIPFQKLPQNNNQSAHRSSQKGKEVDRTPEPTSNELEESQFGTTYQLGSSSSASSMNRSPPRSPDWFVPISVRGPPQGLSSQTSASSSQAPALNYSAGFSALCIPPQFRSTLSRLLTARTPIMRLSIREFIALGLTAHYTKSNLKSPLTVTPVTPRGSAFTLSFLNNGFIGLTLQSHDKEDGIANPKDKKTCPFGCLVDCKHQHIPSTRYLPPLCFANTSSLYSHIGSHPPLCPLHPDFFTGDFEEVKDIVNVAIWFRYGYCRPY